MLHGRRERAKLGLPKIEKTSDRAAAASTVTAAVAAGQDTPNEPPRSVRSSKMSPSQSTREPFDGVFFWVRRDE